MRRLISDYHPLPGREGVFYTVHPYRRTVHRRYYKKVQCRTCSGEMFQELKYFKAGKRPCCSTECQYRGTPLSPLFKGRKLKRGTHGHVLIYAPYHPNARKSYVAEHRLKMEWRLKRLLTAEEYVHHIDCDPQNNHINNLIVVSKGGHTRLHAQINRLLKELLKRNIVRFDRATKTYELV